MSGPNLSWRVLAALAVIGLAGVLSGWFVGYTYDHGGARLVPFLAGIVLLTLVVAVPLQLMLYRAELRTAQRRGKPVPQPWHAGWKLALAAFAAGFGLGLGGELIQTSVFNGAA